MPITIETRKARQLTVLTGTGDLSLQDVLGAVKEFYEGDLTTDVLWDLRDATAKKISSEQVRQIGETMQDLRKSRKGGKTAIVADMDLTFGLARMLQTIVEVADETLPVTTGIFRDMETALQWLNRKK